MTNGKIDIEKLLSFIGYGNPQGDYWFLGIEEGLDKKIADDCLKGNCKKVISQLIARSSFDDVMDLKEAHKALNVTKFFEGDHPPLQITWAGIIKLVLKQNRDSFSTNKEYLNSLRTFQKEKLGTKEGNIFLAELFPLPFPSMHGRYNCLYNFLSESQYSKHLKTSSQKTLQGIPDKPTYLNSIKKARTERLKDLISKNHPKVIVCYGKRHWDKFRDVFDGAEWEAAQSSSPFEKGTIGKSKTRIILTPHFVARNMDEKWPELWKLIHDKPI